MDSTQSEKANTINLPEDGTSYAVISSSVYYFSKEESKDFTSMITNVSITDDGVYVEALPGSKLESLGVGDIFCLLGEKNSTFGEVYFGKISSMGYQEECVNFIFETPMVDEVFDALNLDIAENLLAGEVKYAELLEGVSIVDENGKLAGTEVSETPVTGLQLVNYAPESLMHASHYQYDITKLDKKTITIELDITKLFSKSSGVENPYKDFPEKKTTKESKNTNVYITATGNHYHRENCHYLYKSKEQKTLSYASEHGFFACRVCKPPVIEDEEGVFSAEGELKLVGTAGFESLVFNLDYDWDLLNAGGLDQLKYSLDGRFVTKVELEANYELTLAGKKTKYETPKKSIQLEGLREKLIPIAFVGINCETPLVLTGAVNKELEAVTVASPLTVGIIVYIDVEGNIKFTASVFFDYTCDFHVENEIVKDGRLVNEHSKAIDNDIDFGLTVEATADVDVNMGSSVLLYVFNLNVVDVAIFKVGVEGEGNAKLDLSVSAVEAGEVLTADYYARAYLKFFQVRAYLKTKVNILDALGFVKEVDIDETLKDVTLKEWGKKNPVKYNPDTMSYTNITAKDENALYYKDLSGKLVKEEGGVSTVIYEEEFFVICGIDQSYIYLLENNVHGHYDMYRINKDGQTKKKIAEDIVEYYMMDGNYMYYSVSFDDKSVVRLDRNRLQESTFISMNYPISVCGKQGENIYLVTKSDWLFGTTCYYYLLDTDGKIIKDYGSNPQKAALWFRQDNYSYGTAAKLQKSGFLRWTAYEEYWVSADRNSFIKTESIAGWNSEESGIFVVRNNDISNAAPYKIGLYQAEDGQYVDVTEVQSKFAFFTLIKARTGEWYFFDQYQGELILYRMLPSFFGKREVKRFSSEEINCDLESCGMVIVDNCLYFYSIINDKEAKVLYRYNLD